MIYPLYLDTIYKKFMLMPVTKQIIDHNLKAIFINGLSFVVGH